MRAHYKRIAKHNVFPVVSILLAVYFFYAFSTAAGVPPAPSLDWSSTMYLVLAVVFFLAPEVVKFERSKLEYYENRLQEAKADVLLLKAQLRTLLKAHNDFLASGTAAQHNAEKVAIPTAEEAEDARQELESVLGEEIEQHQLEAEIEHFLAAEDFDLESALWDMRKVMDKELRRLLGAQPGSGNSSRNARPLSSAALIAEFERQFPDYAEMQAAFDIVLRTCEAAAHGQDVPPGSVLDALQMGFRILDALRKLNPVDASRAA